ncbi:Multidrug resistance-associated protein 4, partial [Nowakowskiella sp. JEL0078]
MSQIKIAETEFLKEDNSKHLDLVIERETDNKTTLIHSSELKSTQKKKSSKFRDYLATILPRDYSSLKPAENEDLITPIPQRVSKNIFIRYTFNYCNELIKRGARRDEDEAANLANRILNSWNNEVKRNGKKAKLWRAMVREFGFQYSLAGFAYFLESVFKILEAVMLGYLLTYFQTLDAPMSDGLIYSAILSAVVIAHAIVHHVEFWLAMRCGMQLRIGFITTIYQKCLKLSISHTSSTGLIVNLVSNDVQRFEDCSPFLHFIWLGPLEAILVWVFMYLQIGISSVIAIAAVFLLIPVQGAIAKQFRILREQAVFHRDERIRTLSDSLAGINVLKLYSWEIPFVERITQKRESELSTLNRANYLKSFNDALFFISSGGEFTSSKIFTTIALTQVVRLSMTNFFSRAVQYGIESIVSFSRIQEFLSLTEITHSEEKISVEENFVNKYDLKVVEPEGKTLIAFDNSSFAWQSTSEDSELKPTLQNISFHLRANEVVGICGPVGSGKSSLLHAVLDEMERVEGQSAIRRRISDGKTSTRKVKFAYVSQSPWIASGTIKDNILFGSDFDENWFWQVVKACALETDLNLFQNRENTLIGERGVTLSGGQRARLSLARAVYYNADIYLLDDPLSAVDTKVGRHIFENCINGILRNKARLLVTHQLQFIRDCDKVLLLENGKVTSFGDFETVVKSENSKFADVLRDFSKKDKDSEEGDVDSMPISTSEKKDDDKITVEDSSPAKEIIKEDSAVGNIGLEIYTKYFASGTGILTGTCLVLLLLIGECSLVITDWWLSRWTQQSVLSGHAAPAFYPIIFAALVIFALFTSIARAFLFYYIGLRSSRKLFSSMLNAVMRSPMSFFQFNPHGRLMKYFMLTSRQIKRIESITRSPVYGTFPSTLEGLSTIRAFDAEDRFFKTFVKTQNQNTQVWFMFLSTSRWLGLRLDFMSSCFILLVSFLAVLLRQSLNLTPGIVGLLLSYTLQLIGLLQWSVRQSAEVENMMVSVERVLEYTSLEPEAPAFTDIRPPEFWPDHGDINIKNMSLTYPKTMKPALTNITIHLKPGQRCGIVGRTGAGKSSFLQAIFRLVEPEPASGAIFIDGIDTSTIGLADLRSRISIIPQEPFCFRGTLRFNIDPFSRYSDQELWKALDAVELKHVIEAMPEKLDAPVSENGGNWSFGERQLICLARAILRLNTKLIVMDEATSNVDLRTDELVQNAIRGRRKVGDADDSKDSLFADATVITIAHRLQTVIDFDCLMVLSGGSLVEFGSPWELLQKDPSDESAWFRRMVEEISNEEVKEGLKKIAFEKFSETKMKR